MASTTTAFRQGSCCKQREDGTSGLGAGKLNTEAQVVP